MRRFESSVSTAGAEFLTRGYVMLTSFFFSSRRRHTRCSRDWSSDVCSSDLALGGKSRCVLIRADMDALPVEEANDVPYRSQHEGKMHACGHDGHVAIGLEVARRLHAAFLPGSVKLAFQPAEEISNGAEAMIRDGVLDAPTVDAAFGIHLWNDLPAGTIALMPGPVMASVDEFEIAILGRGGHAAAPHQ